MKKFILLLFVLISHIGFSQNSKSTVQEKPKLVVGIIVDQMRADYIERFWSKFGEDGFKRLWKTGYHFDNAHYNYVPTYTGPGHASVYCGAGPAVHGIVGNNWYSREEGKIVYCASDKKERSIGSTSKAGMMSPRNMLSSSIADAMKLSSGGKGKTIGIALKDRGAILPAGHTADAAYWFDDLTGHWISSSYYMDTLPEWTRNYNGLNKTKKYLEQDWNTLLPIEQYTECWKDDNTYETAFKGEAKPVFPHRLPELMSKNGNLALIKTTPFGNDLSIDFAIEAMKREGLGKDEYTDMLALSLSSTDYVGHAFGTGSIELADTYLRLDLELAKFLKALDAEVGIGNYILFLTADHGACDNFSFLMDKNIPAGTFNDSLAEAILKKELKKQFGDSLVLSFINQQLYLNRERIVKEKYDYNAIIKSCSDLFYSLEGVSKVYTSEDIMKANSNAGMLSLIQNGYMPKRCGDLAVVYLPNWAEWGSTGTTHGSGYTYDTHVPLVFFGRNIKAGLSNQKIEITDIAPTIAKLLKIPATDGSIGKILEFK